MAFSSILALASVLDSYINSLLYQGDSYNAAIGQLTITEYAISFAASAGRGDLKGQ